jgi:hypothetical protein
MKKTMLIGHCSRNLGTQITTYSYLREKLPLEILIEFPRSRNVPLRCNFRKLQQWSCIFLNPNRATGSIDGGSSSEKFLSLTMSTML